MLMGRLSRIPDYGPWRVSVPYYVHGEILCINISLQLRKIKPWHEATVQYFIELQAKVLTCTFTSIGGSRYWWTMVR